MNCSAEIIQRPIVRRSRYLAEHTKRRSLTGAAGAAAAGREENWVTVAQEWDWGIITRRRRDVLLEKNKVEAQPPLLLMSSF